MADSTYPITTCPEANYLTRNNVRYPGSQANANAAATRAVTVINDRLPTGVTIAGGSITAAS